MEYTYDVGLLYGIMTRRILMKCILLGRGDEERLTLCLSTVIHMIQYVNPLFVAWHIFLMSFTFLQ